MDRDEPFYFGNAELDRVGGTGWFLGQFVPAQSGLRHQTDVELKWGIHPNGEKRSRPWAQGHATTVAILIRGALRIEFHVGEVVHPVTLQREGDYVVYGPQMVHSWEAIGDALVLTIRFPSIDVSGS
jgi:hypothetical protein